jgi:glycyl-tRNA synthetase beta subunit
LVKEFTELQGIIGGLYARAQGHGESVAQAIYDQYTPASIEDRIPKTVEGQLFGIADRIQTIVANVRHWHGAHRFEGSLRTAAGCQCDREDSG